MADEVKKPEVEKKKKKLGKSIAGTVVIINEGTTGKVINYDFAKLPPEIQKNLGPFGLGHKLGDAAAGKSGQEALDAIQKVYDGLVKGDWLVRAPAAEKVSKKGILDKFNALNPKEQEIARGLLEKLGILPAAKK
jgi:hypothetical protein